MGDEGRVRDSSSHRCRGVLMKCLMEAGWRDLDRQA